jgi:H+/gluconate symporter-like permease
MFGLGIWYLERQRVKAAAMGEGFVPAATDKMPDHDVSEDPFPHWAVSVLPLVLVLSTIMLPRIVQALRDEAITVPANTFEQVMAFAASQPILWPSVALLIGSVAAVVLLPRLRGEPVLALGRGAEDAIMPLMNTAAVIGFGGIVVHTTGFGAFTTVMLDSGLPPLMSLFASASMTSALVGSSSGGLQIFMETMAPQYLAMGIAPETLHRLAAIISGGFDSLPHCGAVVAMLTITGQTHKQAYRDIAVITVAIPVIAALVLIALVSAGLG